MRRFTFRPPLTLKGRKWKGLRGWAGKPFHPPLTDIPVAAYCFAAAFDVLSMAKDSASLREAGTYVLVGGAIVSMLAMLTGWADWHRSSQVGTQARRTINAHAIIMIVTSVLVLLDIALRVGADGSSDGLMTLLSLAAAGLVTVGATFGGSLVFDYGFNVETSGDHPVWHENEDDVYPGQQH